MIILIYIVFFILLAAILIGVVYHLGMWISCLIFQFIKSRYHKIEGFAPPISCLKPVRGINPGDEDNFRSFFELEYPKYELLFLIHKDAKNDPAIKVIESLIKEYPKVDAKILRISEHIAVHEKVNNYIEGIERAAYEYINITDADCYVDKNYLSRDIQPLANPRVGIVTSVQTMNDFRCAACAFEGLVQNYEGIMFWFYRRIIRKLDFVYGHSILFRKKDFYNLDAISQLKDHMIDDQAWGNIYVKKAKMKIILSSGIAHTRYTKASWKKAANHIIRWGRFQRHYAGWPYFFLIFNFLLGWSIAMLLFALFIPESLTFPVLEGLITVRNSALMSGSAAFALRFLSVFISNLMFGDFKKDLRYIWTLILRDFFTIYAIIKTYFINSFEHAGITYLLQQDGTMKRKTEEKEKDQS